MHDQLEDSVVHSTTYEPSLQPSYNVTQSLLTNSTAVIARSPHTRQTSTPCAFDLADDISTPKRVSLLKSEECLSSNLADFDWGVKSINRAAESVTFRTSVQYMA